MISRALLTASLFGAFALAATAATGTAPPSRFTRVATLGSPLNPIYLISEHVPVLDPFWMEFSTRTHQQFTLSSAGSLPFYVAIDPRDSIFNFETNLSRILASDAEACLIVPPDLDLFYGHSAATTGQILTGICQALEAKGVTPILAQPLPAAAGGSAEKAAWVVALRQIVAGIETADPAIIPVDWSSTLDLDGDGYADAASFNAGLLTRDAVSRLAAAAADRLRYSAPTVDIYRSLTPLTPNPLLNPGSDLSRPFRWVAQDTSTPAGTTPPEIISSTIKRPGNLGYWWQLTVGGPDEREIALHYNDDDSTGLNPGDTVELLAEYETETGVSPGWYIFPTPYALPGSAPDALPPLNANYLTGSTTSHPIASGTLRSAPVTVQDGQNRVTAHFRVHGSGTFRLGRVYVHRVSDTPAQPGPYRDDLDAALHGVKAGATYLGQDAALHTQAGGSPVRSIALWGDSLMNATSYAYTATVGGGSYGTDDTHVIYGLRATLPDPQNHTVAHVNPGGTGPLSVTLDGTALTVTLGRQDGVITSTVQDVRTAVLRDYGQIFIVSTASPGTARAATTDQPLHFAPKSGVSSGNVFTWLQVLSGQAFDLSRRLTQDVSANPLNDQSGDWDYGYDYATSRSLAANPGPAGDILSSSADLIVGCSGAYDLDFYPPQEICDRIVALWEILRAADRSFVWMAVPPRGLVDHSLVTQTNELLRQAALEHDVVFLPWLDSLQPLAIWGNGVVPVAPNAQTQAAALRDFFRPLLAPAPRYDLTPASWITANPTLATLDSTGAPAFWNTGVPTANGMLTRSGAWTRVVSQTAAPLQLQTQAATTNWNPGDLVEGVAEVTLPTGEDLSGLSLTVTFNGTAGKLSAMEKSFQPSGDLSAFTGVLRTLPCAIPRGTTGITLTVTSTGSGSYLIRNAGVRRAIPTMSPGAPPAPLPDGPALTSLDNSDPARTTGNYAGSIYAYGQSLNPHLDARGGFDSFRLDRKGNYTARGRIDGVAFSIKGHLDATTGSATSVVKLPAPLSDGTAPVELTLYLATGDDGTVRITGVFTGLAGSLPLAVDLVQTGTRPTAAVTPGAYTALIDLPIDNSGTSTPQAPGVATFSLTATGSLRCHYVLPDGTLGTRSAKLSGAGVWQFYFPATGAAAAKGGLLTGHLRFRRSADPVDFASDLDGRLSWQVPANPKAALYPAGFETRGRILGWKYTPAPRKDYALPGLAGFTGNNAVFSLGDILTLPAAWGRTDAIKASGLAARLNRATGLITGSYTDPATRTKYSLYTIILQNQGYPGAGLAKSRTAVLPAALTPVGN